MFKYEEFEIVREDDHNLVLYEKREVDEVKVLKTKKVFTGKKVKKKIKLGYYHQFDSAIKAMVNRILEQAECLNHLKIMMDNLKKDFQYLLDKGNNHVSS